MCGQVSALVSCSCVINSCTMYGALPEVYGEGYMTL